MLQLEKKFFAKFTPLYEKRATIVNGKSEPTEEEVEAGKADDEDEDEMGHAAAGSRGLWRRRCEGYSGVLAERDEELVARRDYHRS